MKIYHVSNCIKLLSLALMFAVITSEQSWAQEEEVEGYVAKVNYDTIYGKVSLHIRKGQLQQVSVKNDDGRENFQVYQVLGCRTEDGSIYHTKKILGKYQFAKLVYPGYASYYYYTTEEMTTESFTEPVLIKPDGEYVTFSALAFRKRVSEFLGDCEAVKLKIENGEYKRKDLEKILDDYNSCISSQTEMRALAKAGKPSLSGDEMANVEKFSRFINKVAVNKEFNGDEELMEMLNDVKEKLSTKAPIPGYLSGAITDKLKDHQTLIKEFNTLINN